MPVKFEWQADQEQEWTEEQEVPLGGETAVSLHRHWRIWLFISLALIVSVGMAYWLLNRRAETTSKAINNDLLASYQLLQTAVSNQDQELFATILLPYQRDWGETAQQLFNRRLFLDRVPLNLWASSQTANKEPVITLAPDRQWAVIETEIPYVTEISDTMTQTVSLLHTAVFENDDGQWRFAPTPDDEAFWGRPVTSRGNVLELIYPDRDAEIGRRLIVDLDLALEKLCQLPTVSCPDTFRVRLRLETDYRQLLALDRNYRGINPRRASGNRLALSLPTATLVGRPLDDAGYQALYRGYAGWLTAVLYHELNRVQQPDHQTIKQQLAQIDLRPPPLIRERPWQVQSPPPIPFPDQDILMSCQETNQPFSVWHYDLAMSTWTDVTNQFINVDGAFTIFDWANLTPMPNDNGAIFHADQLFSSEGDGRLYLWQDGDVTILLDDLPSISWLPTNFILPSIQNNRYYFFYQPDPRESSNFVFHWLDLLTCPGPACKMQTGEWLPYWSPQDTQAILIQIHGDGAPTIALSGKDGQPAAEIGNGWSPLWLDDITFAYLRPDPALDPTQLDFNNFKTELVITELAGTAVAPKSSRVILDSETLLAALPEAGPPSQLTMLSVFSNPTQPDNLFITASTLFDETIRQDYVFGLDRDSEAITVLGTIDNRQGFPLELHGDGRFLTTFTSEGYLIYDLNSQRTMTYPLTQFVFPQVDWSANEQWLIVPEAGILRLVAPGSGYERPLFHGLVGCGTAVWVQR